MTLTTSQINYSVVRIKTLFDTTPLSTATGFFYEALADGRPIIALITNWHVISGRNPENPLETLHQSGGIPNRIEFHLPSLYGADGKEVNDVIFHHEKSVDLYKSDNTANWIQHRDRNLVDIAALYFEAFTSNTLVKGINKSANQLDMAINIGSDVFILGYPLGFSHFASTPIWKKGSIASEPHLETPESKRRIVIDATTRSGMSGSPVILRESTHYLTESGIVKVHPNAMRFIGVYASRPSIDSRETEKHELGYVYKSGLISEIFDNGIPGTIFGEWRD